MFIILPSSPLPTFSFAWRVNIWADEIKLLSCALLEELCDPGEATDVFTDCSLNCVHDSFPLIEPQQEMFILEDNIAVFK